MAPAEADLPGGGTLPSASGPDHLDAFDQVTVTDAKGVEIFEITVGTFTGHARVERTADGAGGSTTFYQLVDIVADESQTDDGDDDMDPEHLRPTPSIPMATEYSHIHFGVWARLSWTTRPRKDELAGIGFVQNFTMTLA